MQIAHPDALVINVAGEASWLMNMQEMGTATQYRLAGETVHPQQRTPRHGAQWQELLHGERYSHSWFEALARFRQGWPKPSAPGHPNAPTPADLDDAIMEMITYDGPVIFDCLVEKHETVSPMIPSGKAHNEMLLGEADTRDAIGAGPGGVLV